MKVSQVMSPNPQTVAPDDSIRHAAILMDQYNIGVLPVCDEDRLVGIVTDRDIVVRSTALGNPPDSTNVSEVMTETVHSLPQDSDTSEAEKLMVSVGVRRIMAVDADNHLVGILSLDDLAVHGAQGAAVTLAQMARSNRSN